MVSQYPFPVSKIITNPGIELAQQKKLVARDSGFHDVIKVTVKAFLSFIGAHQIGYISTDDFDIARGIEGKAQLNQLLVADAEELF